MKREIVFDAAFDKRSDDPNKNYGVHGVNMKWFLLGELGCIQFVVYTNWHLPHVEKLMDERLDSQFPHLYCRPQPADVGYHSPKPMYEGQTKREDCPYIKGGTCYYDGSGLLAEEVFALLVREGGEAVWKKLEETYVERFGELK